MIKWNKEVTLKTRETHRFYRKPQKLKIAKNVFSKIISKKLFKIFSFLGKSHSAKKQEVDNYCRSYKLGVSFKVG